MLSMIWHTHLVSGYIELRQESNLQAYQCMMLCSSIPTVLIQARGIYYKKALARFFCILIYRYNNMAVLIVT